MSKAEKPPLPSPSDLRRLQWLLGSLLVMISAGTVLFLEIEAWGLLLSIVAVSGLMLFRADLPARVPAWVHRLAFPVILALLAWDLWSGMGLLPSMLRLALWLLLYRSLCHRTRREELQLILLGLFLIVVAGVLTISIAFILLLVLFTLCALALLLVVTTGDAIAAPEEGTVYWYRGYSVSRVLRRTLEILDLRQLVGGLFLFAVLVGASALIFVLIPRVQMENSFFLEQLFPRKAYTGFSDSIRFGEVTEISQDNSLAFTLDLPPGEDPPLAPYFRMLVLDEYLEGGGFRVSAALRREYFGPERATGTIEGAGRLGSEQGRLWTIYLEPGVAKNLPLPGVYNRVRLRDSLPLRQSPALRLIQLRDEPLAMLPYRIEGAMDLPRIEDLAFLVRARQYSAEMRTRAARRLCLELPADAPSREVLAEVLKEASLLEPEAAAFAQKATSWLRSRHSYSLSSTLAPGKGDAVVRWLRDTQPGHCELFASSLVLLARAAGHPARVVVGFRGGSWNAFSNSMSIRNRDAHAWCEIWDGRGAWLRFDPTPGANPTGTLATTTVAALQASADKGWSARMDSLRVLWYRRIVNFDQQTQMDALVSFKRSLERLKTWLAARTQAAKEGLSSLLLLRHQGAAWLVLVGSLVLSLVLSWLVISYRRNWRWRRVGPYSGASLDPVRREAGRWLRRLRSAGIEGAVCQELECLRFGAAEQWSQPAAVFERARACLRKPRRSRS